MEDSEDRPAGTEIVIGLVGALGVDMDVLVGQVSKAVDSVGFAPKLVHLSQLMGDIPGFELHADASELSYQKRVFGLMESGNDLREKFGGDALAKMAVLDIRDQREEITGDSEVPADRTAFIIRSLKHPDEVQTLREIYGNSFFLVAAYTPRDVRIANVAEFIRRSESGHDPESFEAEAVKLVQKDEDESENVTGQHVREVFWRGDAYIDSSKVEDAERSLSRIIHLWFSSPYITPSREEFAMFVARAASYRSAAMGRQVGASITTDEGSIVATGTNEVAKSGGGQYWEGDEHDARDHKRGFDSSDTMRRSLLEDALKRLMKSGWKPPKEGTVQDFASALMKDPLMDSAEFRALTEYQRAVHAEMSALMDAETRGVGVTDNTLYCTSFPCHACARHIVAAGIKRVVYIEPYPKSLVKTLYSDSISVDDSCEDHRVRFEPYIGLAPRRYLSFFQMGRRKNDDGTIVEWQARSAKPNLNGWESWLSIEKENLSLVDFRLLPTAEGNSPSED